MRRYLFLFALRITSSRLSGTETLDEGVRAIVAAEKKFFQTGQEKGTRAAFLEFLAPDGVVLNGPATLPLQPVKIAKSK